MARVADAAADRAFELVNGYRASQLVGVAAHLKIPDLLANGPMAAQDLATATGIHADRLRRVLRGLAALGVLIDKEDGRFGNSDVGELFREGTQGSYRALVMMLLPESYRDWEHLLESLRSGMTGHEIAFGRSLWDSLRRDPDFARRFNQSMVSGSERIADFVASSYDFSAASLIVDVGGGNGALAAGVLRAHSHLRGLVCDLPAGLAGAREYLKSHHLLDRCTTAECDFFESVPHGGDVYLLKNIIHDWEDDPATRILATCRTAAGPGGRLVIVERVLPAHVTAAPEHLNAAMMDLQMMVQLGSRERTQDEYRTLMERAGWQFVGAIPGGLYAMFEGVAG